MSVAREALVAAELKTLDCDRYYASLILPAGPRAAIQALWAFSAEVATISERVSEPAPGEIRLQWWVDALDGKGHGDVRANPIADALLDALKRYGLETGPLQRLLAARRFDLYQDPMPDLETFEGYAGETHSILFQYAAMILNKGGEIASGEAAGHLGVAQALAGHLSAFGYNASRGRIFLPFDVFAGHGVSETDIFSGQATAGIKAARTALLQMAKNHLVQARAAIAALAPSIRPAFAQIAILPKDIEALGRSADRPYEAPSSRADWRKIAALYWWAVTNG